VLCQFVYRQLVDYQGDQIGKILSNVATRNQRENDLGLMGSKPRPTTKVPKANPKDVQEPVIEETQQPQQQKQQEQEQEQQQQQQQQ
jgi:hypothetical protein